ncbi:hypothetical protein AQ490_24405 [Wenjunlia vitaminophila]|uniref:Uncharacterized protein n=1 Tax=Wenjunlia vitaminophila TaxID=76728 RepID=A0A0T6LRC5_WENVI|nr:hypothetical protein [Wenjunlia vitaminophila]KRV48552.1 hypothetical protein AQ490_24405 [Wenjunlia vitaminophila]
MNGVGLALRALDHGERRLEHRFLAAAQRHRTEHEFCHVAGDLARWSREHHTRLVAVAAQRGLNLRWPSSNRSSDLLAGVRTRAAEAVGRRPEPGLLLLRDLRELYLAASRNSLHWEMLAQAAQATRDTGLLDVVSRCHPQTLRQVRWTNTMIKTLSPQVLTGL